MLHFRGVDDDLVSSVLEHGDEGVVSVLFEAGAYLLDALLHRVELSARFAEVELALLK